ADDGRTWREAARIAGPTPGTTGQFRFADWPAGTRRALLRFEMTGNNTVGVMSFRADADYKDPLAGGGFHPFRVVHRRTEAGRARAGRPRTGRPSPGCTLAPTTRPTAGGWPAPITPAAAGPTPPAAASGPTRCSQAARMECPLSPRCWRNTGRRPSC